MPARPARLSPLRTAEIGLLYCSAIWGSTFFVVKDVLDHVSPTALVGWRFTIAAVLIGGYCIATRRPLFAGLWRGVWLGALLAILYLAQTIGLLYTSASNSGFITGLFIIFVPLLMLLDRQPPALHRWAAVVIALGGLWLLTGGIAGANRGDYITLLVAFTYAAHVFYVGKYVQAGDDPVVLCFQQVLITGAGGLAATLLAGQSFAIPGAGALGVVLFLTLLPTLSAFMIQLMAQRLVNPVRTSLIFALEPVFAALFAWTLGGEQATLLGLLGGAVIVFAMVLSELPLDRRAVSAAERAEGSQTA